MLQELNFIPWPWLHVSYPSHPMHTIVTGPPCHCQGILRPLPLDIGKHKYMEGPGSWAEVCVKHLGDDLLRLVDLAQLGGIQKQPELEGISVGIDITTAFR